MKKSHMFVRLVRSELIFGPTTQISELGVGKYDELMGEIYRFANFGLFLARQGSLEKFLKYKDVVSVDR